MPSARASGKKTVTTTESNTDGDDMKTVEKNNRQYTRNERANEKKEEEN